MKIAKELLVGELEELGAKYSDMSFREQVVYDAVNDTVFFLTDRDKNSTNTPLISSSLLISTHIASDTIDYDFSHRRTDVGNGVGLDSLQIEETLYHLATLVDLIKNEKVEIESVNYSVSTEEDIQAVDYDLSIEIRRATRDEGVKTT